MIEPAPLGVYVHWPYCARICPYCDFNVYRSRHEDADALTRAIVEDLAGQARRLGRRRLVSLYFGGGTPSLMAPDQVARVVEAARTLWPVQADVEVTLEANPTDAEAGRFGAFAAAGVNRLSLGLQALDDQALAFLGRNHDAAQGRRAAEAATRAFPRVSLDLIYARPGQTPRAWRDELATAAALGAEHLSPYQLTIEDGTAFGREARRGRLSPPDDALGAALYDTTQETLEAAGFTAYEVSNHARGEAARSRHNLVYWRGHEYVGAGPGAHGRLELSDARSATLAHARPEAYVAAVAETGVGFAEVEALDPESAAEERLLMGLRIEEGAAFDELAALGLAPDAPRVQALTALGLIAPDPERLRATPAGRLVLDSVIAELAGA